MVNARKFTKTASLVIAAPLLGALSCAAASPGHSTSLAGRAGAPPTSLRHAFERVDSQVRNSVVAIHTLQRTTIVKTVTTGILTKPAARHDGAPRKPDSNRVNSVKTTTITTTKSVGSGVIVRADGYIVTNDHVVRGADYVKVILCNGLAYRAKVVGVDPNTDLAVVKIHAPNLQPAVLGHSARLRVGQWVCAFGAPFGLGRTLTNGVISAVHRRNVGYLVKQHPTCAGLIYEDFTQSDTPINPGNSGGPLFNLRGHVVGINSAIMKTGTGGFEGVSYSIPSSIIRNVSNAIIAHGKVVRAWVGVAAAIPSRNCWADLTRSEGYSGPGGALLTRVEPGSPAAKAGLVAGDVLIACNGRRINNVQALRESLAVEKPGTQVHLSVFHDGHVVQHTATMAVEPKSLPAFLKSRRPQKSAGALFVAAAGLAAQNATPGLRKKFAITGPAAVVITAVDPVSPAAYANIGPGTTVLRVGNAAVSSVSALRAALASAPAGKAVLYIRPPHGQPRAVTLPAGTLQIPNVCF